MDLDDLPCIGLTWARMTDPWRLTLMYCLIFLYIDLACARVTDSWQLILMHLIDSSVHKPDLGTHDRHLAALAGVKLILTFFLFVIEKSRLNETCCCFSFFYNSGNNMSPYIGLTWARMTDHWRL